MLVLPVTKCFQSRHPLSEVPIDLLFLHIVFPVILESIKPRELFSPLLHRWWEHAAHEFRLTSFLFGERVIEEEEGSRFTWRRLPLVRDLALVRRDGVRLADDGGFARVPASDTVALPEHSKQMLVPTNEAGAPLDDRGIEVIEAQNEAARKAHRDPAEDYQVVYLPPNFTKRVMAFVSYLWLTGACMSVIILGTPILVGRRILDLFPGLPVHDGYSFLIGVTGILLVTKVLDFLSDSVRDIRYERRIRLGAGDASTADGFTFWVDLYLGGTLRVVLWALKHVAIWTMLGFALPLLMATVLELYIVLPIRTGMYPSTEGSVVTLHIWEDWALGCILATILVRMAPMQPRTPLVVAWDEVSCL